MLKDSIYFGALLSLGAYAIGVYLRRRTGWSFLNPLLTAIVLVIVCLLCTGMRYKDYLEDADWVSYLLTPATICLAVPALSASRTAQEEFQSHHDRHLLGRAVKSHHRTAFSTVDAFRPHHLRYLPTQIHHHRHWYGCSRRIGRLCLGHSSCHHPLGCIGQHLRREIPKTPPHRRAHCQRHCFG